MAWFVIPTMEACRIQLNAVFPDRDKRSDGGIGDTSHLAGVSGHNPDRTGNAEYKDGDSLDEVRARDFDKDLRHDKVTAEQVVQHLVRMARAGNLWWVRYIIFNGRIWRASNGWVTETYTGANKHPEHWHMSGQYNQASDNYKYANYRFEELVGVSVQDVITALESEEGKSAIQNAVWNLVMGTSSTAARWPEGPNKTARNWLMLAPIHALDSWKNSVPIVETVRLIDAELDVVRSALPTNTDQDERFDTLRAHMANLVSGLQQQQEAQQAMLHNDVLLEINEVPGETLSLLTDPGTPDDGVAVALLQLLGDRAPAVLAAMNARQ